MGKQKLPQLSGNSKEFLKKVGQLAKPALSTITAKMDEAVQPAAEQLASKKKGLIGRLWDKAAPVVKSLAPTALSFIPGIGPALAGIASAVTGNDDEWFEEFKSAGATFNELLADTKLSEGGEMRLVTPGLAVLQVDVLRDSANPVSTYEQQYLPILLAYVRKKTNNVLVTTESDYWTAFVTGSRLYAIYYTLQKYIKLTEDLPTNIPALTGTLPLINPVNYSALVGIADSLKNYLQITIKLPFAWTEYLRWRFGTMFMSENTGKAGLISYDFVNLTQGGANVFDASVNPTNISAYIDSLKAVLASCSRAVADIKLAYDDHQLKYDVEARHYDAKEFNLRCNLNSERTRGIPSLNWKPLGTLIYMDSRLDSSAAIQAITLSTAGSDNNAPFHISSIAVAWYQVEAYTVPYYDQPQGVWAAANVPAGWHTFDVDYELVDRIARIDVDSAQGAYSATYTEFMGYVSGKSFTASTIAAAAVKAYLGAMAYYCVDALQIHNQDFETIFGNSSAGNYRKSIKSKLLSYDAAIITGTQIESIHRIALRNLFRGEYKAKKPSSQDPKIVEPIKDLVQVTNEAVENNMKAL